MKILDWYLGRSILQTTGFALLVLVGISTLIKFIEQLKYVGRGSYDVMTAGLYTLFSVPADVVTFFPMATLIGGLTGLVVGGVQSGIDAKRGLSKDARLATATNVLNQVGITSTLQNNYDNTVTSAGIAKDMEEAAASGDVFKYKNLQADEFFNFVTSRLPSGMHDVTVEQLNMLKKIQVMSAYYHLVIQVYPHTMH